MEVSARIFNLVIVTVLFALWSQMLWATEARHALVIGNAAYQHTTALENTLNDVRDLTADLTAAGFQVTRVEDVDLDGMIDAVDGFVAQLHQSGGVGLLYYSGHGVQVDGRNYLVPVDARLKRKSRVKYEAYALDDALRRMGGRGAGSVNLVILDACRDNPFAATKGAGDKGLARVEAPESTLILYAAKPGQTASDNPGGRNGLFTKHLRQAIQQPGLNVEASFADVVKGVYRESNRDQYPWKEGVLLSQFFFHPGGAPAPGPIPPPPPPVAALGHLQVSVNADGAEVTVNGRAMGRASAGQPLNLRNLPLGRVKVEVTASGHQPWSDTASLKPNQWVQMAAVLQPKAPLRAVRPTTRNRQLLTANISPSFDCNMASKPDEYAICGSLRLAELDREMAVLYKQSRSSSSSSFRSGVRAAQRAWLKRRTACKYDESCIEVLYLDQIQYLRNLEH